MNTIIEKSDNLSIEKAGEILKRGGLVAFPTETVYGLGADALDENAAKKIYEAKGRPSDNPLIVHIDRMERLERIVKEVPRTALKLAEAFWPGPLTMIFEKTDAVPLGTTGGLETVAVRMPDHPVALKLICQAGGYIAAPSANRSGRPSPTTALHVAEDMDGIIDMILDGGNVDIGVESTIVDLTGDVPMILRPGKITLEDIKRVAGTAKMDPGLLSKPNENVKPKAPGMKYRHYAPKAEMDIIKGAQQSVLEYINNKTRELWKQGKRVGVVASAENEKNYCADIVKCVGSKQDIRAVAHNLYRVLREFDKEEVDYIFSECFEEGQESMAVMNRLTKAAGYRIIEL